MKDVKELTRTQILTGKYKYPQNFINLIPTNHFLDRIKERGIGVGLIPTVVKITENNVHSAKTEDGENLSSVVVRIKYNKEKFLFICFSPTDGAMKTLWFRDKNKRKKGS